MASVPYVRPPDYEYQYEVGDTVEVFCDHDKNGGRSIQDQCIPDRWVDGT